MCAKTMKAATVEQQHVNELLNYASDISFANIDALSKQLTADIQKKKKRPPVMSKFMTEYKLNTQEGLALMTLAEALLRIPDTETMEKLIEDKIVQGNWDQRSKQNNDFLVLLGTTGLKLGKSLFGSDNSFITTLTNIFKPLSRAAIRQTVKSTIHTFADQFILADTIENAITRSNKDLTKGIWFSYDMLGESAVSQDDAEDYFQAYQHAIECLKQQSDPTQPTHTQPGISIKLSAISPQVKTKYWHKTIATVSDKLLQLVIQAKDANIQINVDAEESWRSDITKAIIEQVVSSTDIDSYDGFGVVIQAYLIDAMEQCRWIIGLAKKHDKKIMVRLVKGAYWDTEIKHAQEQGYTHYPVFTRKHHTDLSYICCAKLFANEGTEYIYPQFGTHHTYTIAAVLELMKHRRDYELQSLYGMCDFAHRHLLIERGGSIRTRIYAPIGGKKDLLAYLVRRILENGANHSVLNNWINDTEHTQDPIELTQSTGVSGHSLIPLPQDLYTDRKNSTGPDLDCIATLKHFNNIIQKVVKPKPPEPHTIEDINTMLNQAKSYHDEWRGVDLNKRAEILEKVATDVQADLENWTVLLMIEGKKTIDDAVSEVRETIDFLNYYAHQARKSLATLELESPTGETNELQYIGRGVVACLSPWNFPLAIFTGQVVAALASGNCVIAKPAQQTPCIADKMVTALHRAGIPKAALHIAIGRWGPELVQHDYTDLVMLTGSTETAKVIQQQLANRDGPIVPILAETGGLNVMIADSSALREQLTLDVIKSAFRSAGQRCSALRVLYLPSQNADDYIEDIIGAIKCLCVDDSMLQSTDVGPLIDSASKAQIKTHIEWLKENAKCLYMPDDLGANGDFVEPCLFQIESISQLRSETFGPVLHIITYQTHELDKIISDINRSGYGLTLGIHSRIDTTIKYILSRTQVGNNYINRDIIGATVGVQPFGGNGLSGTGPKAGGPNMLRRLCHEKTITNNIAATGGNIALINLAEKNE